MTRVVVLYAEGRGVAAAFRYAKPGHAVTLLEASQDAGGMARAVAAVTAGHEPAYA